ncbi:helix-turn-helix domain-containing protein [Paenibacillus sp. Soil787]|uniref:helix-turn-helix domain-containing protein n=1 Tax=Paenibacillus sp. Soil787 TaxID=1736411 RepID=UPI00070010FB|nr:helix-turn-helix domain-containing protein [Paenibacillus sp. Soil787]KRF44119.1 hypothetical protein ASG93_04225 [Paenibacillus sp. Soil787]
MAEVEVLNPTTLRITATANAIGTTRETVNRLLNQLRKEGIVETDHSGFVIHDIEVLWHWREN